MEWDTAMDDWECIGDNGCGLFAEVRKWRASSPMIDVLRRHIESAETLLDYLRGELLEEIRK